MTSNRTMRFFYTFLIIGICLFSSCEKEPLEVSLLIKNATILEGTAREAYQGDVWIDNGNIAGVGQAPPNLVAGEVVDASGMVLAPGFIDLHAHGNPKADFSNFLTQGVTTISLGQDGFSPDSLANWMRVHSDSTFTVNLVMFAGHSTLRNESGIGYKTGPTSEEIQKMTSMLASTFEAGVFGLSTGLEYRPGGLAETDELRALAEVTAQNGGLIMSHIRNEDDDQVEQSIKELLELGQNSPVHISHIKVVYGKGAKRAEDILELIDSARRVGTKVTADLYPFTASYTGIGILFPDWAKRPNDYNQVKAKRHNELREYLINRVERRNGPEATLLGTGKWKGLNLAQMEEQEGRSWVDVLIDDIGPRGASGAYFIMDEELQARLLQDPNIAVVSDGSPTMNHPRGYGAFSKIIRKYVREDSVLTLNEAIRKMTSLPADILGIEDRGRIKVGNVADLVLFDPMEFKDNAIYENPHQFSFGVKMLILNGKVVLVDGEVKTNDAGVLLKKNKS